jgi:2-phosphoglycerate kinase
MAKLLVIDEQEETKIPFLRGMLIKSLQRSGLEFVDAYKLASEIREDLEDVETITTENLRKKIIDTLKEDHPGIVLGQNPRDTIYTVSIEVTRDDGHAELFSRGIFVKRLLNAGIPAGTCNTITRQVHSMLIREKMRKISAEQLITYTYETVRKVAGQKSADCYLIWCDFNRSHLPLLILIGGIPGSGKSTVATELANQMSIIRTQSTDMLREVMRALIPKRLSPSLHGSSFNAGKALHTQAFYKANKSDALVSGFKMQSDMVSVACEAVLNRAINERVSMILEGVHLGPSLYSKLRKKDAIAVPIMLSVLDQKRLKRNFKGRSKDSEKRAAKRYLDNFDLIWQLQAAVLSDADAADIEIVDNVDIDETISDICRTVTETLEAHYKGKIKTLRTDYTQA